METFFEGVAMQNNPMRKLKDFMEQEKRFELD